MLEGGGAGADSPLGVVSGVSGMVYDPPAGVCPPWGIGGVCTFELAGTVTLAGGM